jgi:hypothetical protein
MRMKFLLGLRLTSLALVLITMLGRVFNYQGPLADPYLATDFIEIYVRNWFLIEAIYWYAKYKEVKKAGVLK